VATPATGACWTIARDPTRFQSTQYEQLVQAGQVEPDWVKRLDIYRQITRLVLDEAFAVTLANFAIPFGLRANVMGFATGSGLNGQPVLEDIWLS
jgi:ABC-type transport system substrate-binding protein